MREAANDHSSTNTNIAMSGTPSVRHSAANCMRGSSPQAIRMAGTRNPSPIIVSTRQSFSGVRRTLRADDAGNGGAAVVMGSGAAAAATGSSRRTVLFADDIGALDLLLTLQPDRQTVDVGI